MAEKKFDKCDCFSSLVGNLGKFLLGLAAVIGACKSTQIAQIIYNNQTQSQNQSCSFHISPNTYKEIGKVAQKLTEVEDQDANPIIIEYFHESGDDKALNISPAFKANLLKDLKAAKTADSKADVLEAYYLKTKIRDDKIKKAIGP